MMPEDVMAASSSAIRNAEPMGTVDIRKSVSLPLPATLNELERFCQVLEQEGVAGITPVRAAPIDGHHVQLYVGIEAS